MKKVRLFFSLAILVLISGCSSDYTVLIRVKNVSAFDYKEVIANHHDYGDLLSGQVTEYKLFDSAYSYGCYYLIIGQDTVDMVAIDYVGETPLSPGKYTYEINVTMRDGHIYRNYLECVED